MAAAQDRQGRTILLATGAGMALLSVLVGAAQLSGGDGNSFRFYNPTEAFLDGFQTNHNAEADVLLLGMVMLAATAADRVRHRQRGSDAGRPGSAGPALDPRLLLGAVGGASLLLVLGVALTASRTGIALLPIAIGAQGLILRRSLAPRPVLALNKRRLAIAAIAVLAMLVMAAVALGQHGALARVWARFHTPTESRPEIWRDSLYALRQYWPWGAGMGSFIPVFAAAERLEVVTYQYVNRAHDDYLEFLIEAGLPGIVVFGLICRQLVQDGWRSWRASAAGSPAQMICGAASLLIITVHSLGDYPLRTMSLACMTAMCAGLLLPIAPGAGPGNVTRP
jgi:O-antigen ligase